MPPQPRVVGAVISRANALGTSVTTLVECGRCFALVAGDRQEHHEHWHKELARAVVGARESDQAAGTLYGRQ